MVLRQCSLLLMSIVLITGLAGCGEKKDALSNESLNTRLEALEKRIGTLEASLNGSGPITANSDTGSTENTSPTTYQTPSPPAFKDVDQTVPTADMINDLAQLGIFKGVGPIFKPYEPITRGEYVIWLFKAYNLMREPAKQIRMSPGFKVIYTDMKASDPSYPYVQAFGNAGFSVGYEDKTFKPNQPLTRQEMIAIKHGVDGGEMYSNVSTEFSDDTAIDPKYHNDVYSEQIFKNEQPRGNNIMRAFGPIKTFKPKEKVLRYEAAATLWATNHRNQVNADLALGRKPNT